MRLSTLIAICTLASAGSVGAQVFRRGDANGDGVVDQQDSLRLLDAFGGGDPFCCEDAADVNDDGVTSPTRCGWASSFPVRRRLHRQLHPGRRVPTTAASIRPRTGSSAPATLAPTAESRS